MYLENVWFAWLGLIGTTSAGDGTLGGVSVQGLGIGVSAGVRGREGAGSLSSTSVHPDGKWVE